MAKPRVFISSTYYDLRSVRADLERFIREQGFDPILNERGGVVYTKEESPEQGCYREIESCDILVSIVGGQFGSVSQAGPYSISQMELKSALEQNKQVYIFVERDVLTEHRTYEKNRDASVNWVSVKDVAIFRFLDELMALPIGNPIMPFDTSSDIVFLLREQWSGLFQRLIQQTAAEGQLAVARELRQGIETVRKLVEILNTNAGSAQQAAQDAIRLVLTPNHPVFKRIQALLKTGCRVFFTNLDELNAWLKTRGFKPVDQEHWDVPEEREWVFERSPEDVYDLLKVSTSLFDDDQRFVPDAVQWNNNLVRREVRPITPPADEDDDLPF